MVGLKLGSSVFRETRPDLSLPRSKPQIVKYEPQTHHSRKPDLLIKLLILLIFPLLKPSRFLTANFFRLYIRNYQLELQRPIRPILYVYTRTFGLTWVGLLGHTDHTDRFSEALKPPKARFGTAVCVCIVNTNLARA